jgi:hypothetical protein
MALIARSRLRGFVQTAHMAGKGGAAADAELSIVGAQARVDRVGQQCNVVPICLFVRPVLTRAATSRSAEVSGCHPFHTDETDR